MTRSMTTHVPIESCKNELLMSATLKLSFISYLFNKYPKLNSTNVIEQRKIINTPTSSLRIAECIHNQLKEQIPTSNNHKCTNILYAHIHDPIVLIKILDHLSPGSVIWEKVIVQYRLRYSTFEKLENCNYAAHLCVQILNLSIVGEDLFFSKNDVKKLLINSLIAAYKKRAKLEEPEDKHLLNWINIRLVNAGLTNNRFLKFKKYSDLNKYNNTTVNIIWMLIELLRPDMVKGMEGVMDNERYMCMYILCALKKIGMNLDGISVEGVIEGATNSIRPILQYLYELDTSKKGEA